MSSESAKDYLQRNELPELIDTLVGRIVDERPADPRGLLTSLLTGGFGDGVVALRCTAQHYAWGMVGSSSAVAQLHSSGTGAAVEEEKPYAELWMGTHPSGPSFVGERTLKDYIGENPQSRLGRRVAERWGDLPFLFKVLSVKTALSIQAHPDKANAERLHAQDPKNYKDNNHKPEMAVALTPFEAMCGFVSPEELVTALKSYPELRGVVGDARASAYEAAAGGDEGGRKAALRDAFGSIFAADAGVVGEAVQTLCDRLGREAETKSLSDKEGLLVRLGKQYPKDVGVLCALFLNHIRLDVGEAIYLPANEPHAYVSGNIVECMAASDNVVRAGLTPKFIDKENLVEMLTYTQGLPPVLRGDPTDEYTRRYVPPFDEFEVHRTSLPGGDSHVLAPTAGPSILVVLSGKGTLSAGNKQESAHRGRVLFLPAGLPVSLAAEQGEHLELTRATVNAQVFGSRM
eukprot:Hpha_TRINITY_DN15850_c1_g9::TRINITY_DN15850_c1_g9_i1::g.192229::m.192229/K01809/manA, MPI; mannose-6-phosphate isomerase